MLNKCYLFLTFATAYIQDTRYCFVLQVLLLVDVGMSNISECCLRVKSLVLESLCCWFFNLSNTRYCLLLCTFFPLVDLLRFDSLPSWNCYTKEVSLNPSFLPVLASVIPPNFLVTSEGNNSSYYFFNAMRHYANTWCHLVSFSMIL